MCREKDQVLGEEWQKTKLATLSQADGPPPLLL